MGIKETPASLNTRRRIRVRRMGGCSHIESFGDHNPFRCVAVCMGDASTIIHADTEEPLKRQGNEVEF